MNEHINEDWSPNKFLSPLEPFSARILAAQAPKMARLLKEVEWSGDRGWGPPCCPFCEAFKPDTLYGGPGERVYKAGEQLGGVQFGHYDNCEWVATLKSAGAIT